jgi:predicted DNA-binding protein YlxM (UPF0122 family)
MKKLISLASAGLALVAITGSAFAATSTTQQATTPSSTSAQQHQYKQHGQFNNQQLLTLLGVNSSTLQQDLKAGKSLADIASAQGINEQKVIDLLVSQSSQRLDQAVQSGKLTQDKADSFKAKLADQTKKRVEQKGFGQDHKGFKGDQNHKFKGGSFKDLASVLGINQQDILNQLKAGQSLAEIASAHNVAEQTLIDQLVKDSTQKIDQAVQTGKLTQDKANQIETKLPDQVKKMVEQKGLGGHQGHHQRKGNHSKTNANTPAASQNNA